MLLLPPALCLHAPAFFFSASRPSKRPIRPAQGTSVDLARRLRQNPWLHGTEHMEKENITSRIGIVRVMPVRLVRRSVSPSGKQILSDKPVVSVDSYRMPSFSRFCIPAPQMDKTGLGGGGSPLGNGSRSIIEAKCGLSSPPSLPCVKCFLFTVDRLAIFVWSRKKSCPGSSATGAVRQQVAIQSSIINLTMMQLRSSFSIKPGLSWCSTPASPVLSGVTRASD